MSADYAAPRIVCIVEGQGEDAAVRSLIRRVVMDIDPNTYVEVSDIFQVSRTKVVRPGQLAVCRRERNDGLHDRGVTVQVGRRGRVHA